MEEIIKGENGESKWKFYLMKNSEKVTKQFFKSPEWQVSAARGKLLQISWIWDFKKHSLITVCLEQCC